MGRRIKRTPYRVLVKQEDIDIMLEDLPNTMEEVGGGFIASYLTTEQYNAQISNPDAMWKCPVTREFGHWDDEWYEENIGRENLPSKVMIK
jgi:hypothetical protein